MFWGQRPRSKVKKNIELNFPLHGRNESYTDGRQNMGVAY